MDASKLQSSRNSVKLAIEIAVNLGLIIFILIWALMILKPFLALVIWGAIIAVASYTPFLKLQSIFKGSKKLAVIAFTVIGLSIVIIPTSMFSESLIKSSINLAHHITEGTVDIPPPSENVKEWPVIGKRVHTAWSKAANDFTLFVNDNANQVKEISAIFLTKAAGVGLGILSLVFAILIAAAFLSNAEVAAMSMQRLFRRLAGEQGDKLLDLSAATIRSVATGVLGIAFIQAMLGGARDGRRWCARSGLVGLVRTHRRHCSITTLANFRAGHRLRFLSGIIDGGDNVYGLEPCRFISRYGSKTCYVGSWC